MEDYKKKYFDAIERLKQWDKEHSNGYKVDDRDAFIFPELAESEEERTRKAIRSLVLSSTKDQNQIVGVAQSDMLRWLEKQGKQKPTFDDTQVYLKGVDRVQGYKELSEYEKVFDRIADTYAHRKNKEGYNQPWYTKERAAEMLYHAKKELGLLVEQKPVEWSEEIRKEFERKYNEGKAVGMEMVKIEWSEEDEALIFNIEQDYRHKLNDNPSDVSRTYYNKVIHWLKSLKDRCIFQKLWRPSENELEVLRLVAEKDGACLMGLYEKLKAL